jgi:hypothetical protein
LAGPVGGFVHAARRGRAADDLDQLAVYHGAAAVVNAAPAAR